MNNVVKLNPTDTDLCLKAAEILKNRIEEDAFTSFVWIAVNNKNEEFFGKDLNHDDKIRILGSLELLKQNIIDSMGAI